MAIKKCKLCDTPTKWIMNIKSNPVSICDECASSIMLQHVKYIDIEEIK
jgi:hypothetical protein